MKKNLLLIIGLSFISILVMGQKYEKTLKSNKISDFKSRMNLSTATNALTQIRTKSLKATELEANKLVVPMVSTSNLKSAIVKKATIDTTHIYPWDFTTQDWGTVPIARLLKYYDEKQNLVQYRALSWHSDTESWVDSVQFFYKYNDANQLTSTLQQSWQFDGIENYSWLNVDNTLTKYNDLGQETTYVYQYWSYDTNDWMDIWQHEFTYDTNGNNTIILESYWDGSQWTSGMNSINKFDDFNHLILNTIQYWDYNSNNWINNYQYVYEYDSKGNNTSMAIQTWNAEGSYWNNYLLQSNTYNQYNKIDNYLVQMWDSFLFEWSDSQRGIYKYDSIGNNTCILGQAYDPYSKTWNSSWVNYYGYNDQNKQISSSSLYWDAGLGNWAVGMQTKSVKIDNSKQNAASTEIASTVVVYPNPAIDVITIRNNAAINQVQVFDVTGNVMLLQQYTGLTNIQLDVTSLKSGFYLLSIKNSDGSSATKRLVKK